MPPVLINNLNTKTSRNLLHIPSMIRLKVSVAFSEVHTEWGPLLDDVLTIVHTASPSGGSRGGSMGSMEPLF